MLPQQSVVALSRLTLPAGKRINKICPRTQELINQIMPSKLFAVIESSRLDPRTHQSEAVDNGGADLLGTLSIDLGHHCKTSFSLNQGHDGMLVNSINDGVAFRSTDAPVARWLKGAGLSSACLGFFLVGPSRRHSVCTAFSGSSGSAINDVLAPCRHKFFDK